MFAISRNGTKRNGARASKLKHMQGLESASELKIADELREEAQHQEDIGNYEEAERVLSESLLLRKENLGDTHLEVAEDYYNLGLLNMALDNNSRAESLLLRSLLIRRLQFDSDHPDVKDAVNMLAVIHDEPAASTLI